MICVFEYLEVCFLERGLFVIIVHVPVRKLGDSSPCRLPGAYLCN